MQTTMNWMMRTMFFGKIKLVPISLKLFKNDFILLNNILNNDVPINFLNVRTIDNGPDSNRTGNKTFLTMPLITRSKLCKKIQILYRVAEMSNTLARLNNLTGYDPFQEPVIFRKNLNLVLFDKLKIFNSI